MLNPILLTLLLSAAPIIELRGGIPFGMFGNGGAPIMAWWQIFVLCVVANTLAGFLVFELMGPVVTTFRRWPWFERHIWPRFDKTQYKLKPFLDKYGKFGLIVFIGVPIPGTGAYTGAVGSYLLGLPRKAFYIANILGVAVAGILVILLCFAIDTGFIGKDSLFSRLFLKSEYVTPPMTE